MNNNDSSLEDPFVKVAQRVEPRGRLVGSWSLEGGVSAVIHALEIETGDLQRRRVVVRRHDRREGASDWKGQESGLARKEFLLHRALRKLEMSVPDVLLLDESCEVLPTPYLVMDWVEGTTEVDASALPSAMQQLAEFLARLHSLEPEDAGLPDLPELEDPLESLPQYLPAGETGDLARAKLGTEAPVLAAVGTVGPRSLLHGDFWPGNVLWQNGQLVAVLDWEDAAVGDPLSDLACCRVELLCQYGSAAMDAFTESYLKRRKPDLTGLPLWETYVSATALASMSDWGLQPEVEAARRQATTEFLELAIREL